MRTLQCGIDIARTSRVTNRAQVEGSLIIVSTYAIAAELAKGQGLARGFDQRLSGATARARSAGDQSISIRNVNRDAAMEPDAIIARFYLRVTVSFPPPSLLR